MPTGRGAQQESRGGLLAGGWPSLWGSRVAGSHGDGCMGKEGRKPEMERVAWPDQNSTYCSRRPCCVCWEGRPERRRGRGRNGKDRASCAAVRGIDSLAVPPQSVAWVARPRTYWYCRRPDSLFRPPLCARRAVAWLPPLMNSTSGQSHVGAALFASPALAFPSTSFSSTSCSYRFRTVDAGVPRHQPNPAASRAASTGSASSSIRRACFLRNGSIRWRDGVRRWRGVEEASGVIGGGGGGGSLA